MYSRSNQPSHFFASAKTHKVESIIDQTGTYNYKDLKDVAKYLGSLAKTNIQKEMLQISQIYSKHHIL